MVFQLFATKETVRQPLVNEPFMGISFDDMKRYIAKRIMAQIKMTPSLIGMLDTIVTDHFQGPIDLYDSDGKPLSPTLLRKHQRFLEEAKIMEIFAGAGVDYFADGSCFGWIGTAKDALSMRQRDAVSKIGYAFGGTMFSGMIDETIKDELEKPRKIDYLAASTVDIMHDNYGVLAYKQEAAGKTIVWRPDQIVHIKLMAMDGQIRGFSGLKALSSDIAIMYMIKENMIAKLENGGSMDNIISMKNAVGGGRQRFERLKLALESFSHIRKSHGNMPIDAEIQVHPLGTALKDMEYRELAMFTISEFCLALGLPTSRVSMIMTGSGGVTNKGELSGEANDAYEEKKNARRKRWEDAWNPHFRKMGFTFRFRRTNLGDDVREAAAATQRAAYVTSVQSSLAKVKKQLTLNAHLQLLSGAKRDILEEDVEKLEVDTSLLQQGAKPNLPQYAPNHADLKGRATQIESQFKESVAKNDGVSA